MTCSHGCDVVAFFLTQEASFNFYIFEIPVDLDIDLFVGFFIILVGWISLIQISPFEGKLKSSV